ncbi:MAG: hypothetical protein NXI04_08175 [Planctomycetaceae bacterium]|nr:hypothetical protein [Planctomycetaceae bacterium]
MAKSTTRRKSTRKRSWAQRVKSVLFQPLPLCLAAAVATVWLCWPTFREQLPSLEVRPEYAVGVEQISITPPPRWVPEDLVERVFQRAEFGDTLSLQDPRLSEKVALAFHTYPWIERLVKVTKSYPARVSVEVVYREPVAMVKLVSGGYLPVDRHGVLLPTSDFNRADIDRYPHVTNVTSIPIRRGEPWGDPAVAGAAELAGVLTMSDGEQASWWKALGLKAIIAPSGVNTEVAELQYRLETSGGSQIVWGRAPSTDYPAELTVAQKLERMAEYHRSYNGFDDAPAPFLIDVRGWQGTTRSLLAEERGTSARQ